MSVHLNSPTNKRVSDVVIRRVLLKSDVRNTVAAAFESSIVVNEALLGACSLLFELSRFFRHVRCIYGSI